MVDVSVGSSSQADTRHLTATSHLDGNNTHLIPTEHGLPRRRSLSGEERETTVTQLTASEQSEITVTRKMSHTRRHSTSRPGQRRESPSPSPKRTVTPSYRDAARHSDPGNSNHRRHSSPQRSLSTMDYVRWVFRMTISPRRWAGIILFLFMAVGIALLLIHPWGGPHVTGGLRVGSLQWGKRSKVEDWRPKTDECHFVSPVAAYQKALQRLRQKRRSEHSSPADLDSSYNNDVPDLSNPIQPSAHVYSPTGHLIISDSEGAHHPIPQLLSLGEKKWEEMLERQSRTLGEAVAEYQRRYGRRPPRGFDLWWEFAQTHNLILPDEYDRIYLDLAPFWALPRREIRKRIEEAQRLNETFTLAIKRGKVEIEISDKSGLKWEGTYPRAVDAASLLKSFARYLPDMRAVYSIHDQPQIYLSWARRSSLVELGLRGEHTTHLKETDDANVRWSRSCPPESNLRQRPQHDEPASLIYDSNEASDLCKNPYLLDMHGLTVEKHGPASHPRPHTALLPLFSLAKTSLNSDILITPLDQFAAKVGKDPEWEDKTDERLVWRGSTTGISWMDHNTPWRKSHRFRLHFHAQNQSDADIPVITPHISHEGGPLKLRTQRFSVSELAEFYYDMKLSGLPLQCNETDGTCNQMSREVNFAPHQNPEELNNYKYMFDIDGNGWSGRFRRLMSTNSLTLKAGIFTEWFAPHLIPWFMYVPTRLDFSDLPTIMSFFRGTPDAPDDGFDEVAKALARNGQCFVQRMYRVQDLQAYMLRLFLEYARLGAPDDVEADFIYEGDDLVDDEEEELLEDEGDEDLEENKVEADQVELADDAVGVDPREEVNVKASDRSKANKDARKARQQQRVGQ